MVVRIRKYLLLVLFIFVMAGMTTIASAQENNEIVLDEYVTLNISEEQTEFSYIFRPTETDDYVFESDINGSLFYTICEELGIYNYYSIGENIAYGYIDPQDVVEGWMNSPGHRANILNPNYTHIVVGVRGYNWVQIFFELI